MWNKHIYKHNTDTIVRALLTCIACNSYMNMCKNKQTLVGHLEQNISELEILILVSAKPDV